MPPATRQSAPTPSFVNFLDLSMYTAGSRQLPRGIWAMEFFVHLFQPTKQDGTATGEPFLSVHIDATPIDEQGNPTGEVHTQELSMGGKAKLSFAPDPETGKRLIPIPNGPASTLAANTNWMLFLKSLYDCGLPPELEVSTLETLDGIWVRTDLVPEPEERKSYAGGAKTGEAAEEQKGPKLTIQAIEILDNGKPWEGTGGIPDLTQPKAKASAKAAAPTKAPAKPAPKAPAKPAPVAQPADDDADTLLQTALTDVLVANPDGTTKIGLRTGTFKALSGKGLDAATVKSLMDGTFASNDTLNAALAPLGYVVDGMKIVQQ